MKEVVLSLSILAGLGCITVNVNFPPHEVEKAAEVIVEEARPETAGNGGGASGQEKASGSAAPAPVDEKGSGMAPAAGGRSLLAAFTPPPVPTQEKKDGGKAAEGKTSDIRINIDTPVIRAIRQSLAKRFPKLLPFYEKGAIGEGNDGYLVIREEDKLKLAEKRDLQALVEEENRDRRNLYKDIVRANDFGEERLKDVQKIFATEWIAKSRTGWWIQTPDGKWARKPAPGEKKDKAGKSSDRNAALPI